MSDNPGIAWSMRSADAPVFAQLYHRHYRSIHEFCRRRLTDDVVDDAVAETFLTAWRRLDDVPAGDEALLWLYQVAYRVVGHQWRSGARRRRLEDRLKLVVYRPASPADESISDADQLRRVLDAASRLGDTDAEVLRLVTWEQLDIDSVSAVLGITSNAVKQRLHRARRNLAEEYRRLEARSTQIRVTSKGGIR